MTNSPGSNCTINDSLQIVSLITEAGAAGVGGEVTTVNEVRAVLSL